MLRSTPSKSKENESRRSRRSSILKPRKPRKPLQNVDFDSPRNETSSTPSKIKRRVSFADKKHVKEFCHTVEQGTVWDNTYEENDSAKGSFVGDANAKTELRENKSAQPSKDATLSIIACNTSEKYMEPSDEKSQLEENVTNIKSYSCGNADFELDGTCIQDLSMEFTASIPTPSLAKENINIKKDNFTLHLNLDTNYVSNSNNVSIQAVPVSARAINSDLSIFEQISKIQNCESANWSAENNMHAKTVSSRNLHYSNIASESTFFKQTQNATQNINESMMLTNVIQPATTDMSCTNVPFNVSMEMTAPISLKIYDENISHPHGENIINENGLRENQIDKTEFFNDAMEITKPVNVPLIAYDKENLRMDELILSRDDGTIFFHNASMEMTTVPLRNQGEITRPIIHKPISEENIRKEKNADNSIDFSEKTKLLCKSMEFTEAVPVSLHEQTLNPICTAESTSFFQTISKAHSPAENSKLALQVDTTANKTIQHTSMEITAPISSLHFTQNARNERENLNISKDGGFQPLSVSTNNLLNPNKTCKSFMEYPAPQESNVHLKKSNDIYMNNTEHSDFTQNARNERENLNISKDGGFQPLSVSTNNLLNPNKTCKSFMEFPAPQESNVHLERSNDIYMNNTEHSERFVKDTINYTEPFRLNFEDNLNDISEYSLLRKTVENSVEELQTIEPPSFISLDNDKEENSFPDALCKDKLQMATSKIDETINNICNSSNQLVINNITQATSRNSVAKDNESCTTLRENESINIENQMEDDCSKNIANETEYNQEVDCQVLGRTIIYGNLINESKHCEINVENLEENISIQNNKCKETKIDNYESPIIKGSEIIAEEEYIWERINDNLRNKKKQQYSDVQKLLIEQCTDPQKAEVIGNQLNSEEYCKENLINDAVRVTGQNEENTEEQCAGAIEESLAEQDPFTSLSQELETYGERDDCIWNVYHENIDRKMIVFGFISNSLLVAMFLSYDFNCSEENLIKRIKIVSRISNDSGLFTKIVHKLILEKLDAELLMDRYKTREDILPMLEYVSQNVKLAMDFMFELKRLDDINLMEINCDQISFVSRSKKMDIIVKVIIKVKRFDELTSSDVNVHCLLGTIKETDVKGLIKNIKKDHMFLRKYMNDVKDYVDIIEMTMPKKCNY
ncbi:uncharacterized protein LOC105256364 isoform X2 [Camponotus floridanus]|uniref:uncharacterized protein LOC105256364 isoform X2 n=1 Tax=Camponotus floridanus TaxID=104421 RepID=UPI000DC6A1C2|nr:uncharacterized protein LOC105256364 isoform X2 [Camponotus floridanus]